MTEDRESNHGIQTNAVTAWFSRYVPGMVAPLSFELIAGGHSNLTYKVVDGAGQIYVLRRPPLHHVLPTAHDVGREFRIISALAPTGVPVPPAIGFCSDSAVTGAPFYVMRFVPGNVLHDVDIALRVLRADRRKAAGESFIDVLADLHAVDPEAVKLGDLGRKEGYIARQLKRWYTQWGQSKTRNLPAIDRLYDFFLARIPEQERTSIVHGDYRLGNCICTETGRIAAVLDWEICTLGDPLADVGYVLATWPHSSDPTPMDPLAPSMAAGFPSAQDLLGRYARRSRRDVSFIDYYVAFAFWKSACILEGVYARYLGGALGETSVDVDAFRGRVERMAELAEETASRIS